MKITRRQLILWSIAAALTIAAIAQWLGSSGTPAGPRKGIFLPKLMAYSPKLTQIRIDSQSAQPWLTMTLAEKGWQIEQADSYPADSAKLAHFIQTLSRANIVANADFPTSRHIATAPWNTTTDYQEQTAHYQLTILGEGNYFRHIWLNDSVNSNKDDNNSQWLRVDKELFSYQIDQPVDLFQPEGGWLAPVSLNREFDQAHIIKLETANGESITLNPQKPDPQQQIHLNNDAGITLASLIKRLQHITPISAKAKGHGTPGDFKMALTLIADAKPIAELTFYQGVNNMWLDVNLIGKQESSQYLLVNNWYLALVD
ncbi:hypothetical protein K0504_05285 [Neiella marina]|uniref:DUF4340 domain-containing protein n=1 Tax=Neiella holothuriorum TaxID=2870530 RepID=A0ABS7EDN0_9GAMM|nr:hypothetical protein [Neiella holothuriorum]MBW8190443.1 hypothetical protein [Neiella holothuriorum]